MNNIEFLNTYLSKSPYRDETLNFILDSQLTLFNSGNFKGKRLYDFSTSCIIHQLMIAHEFYPEITIMKIDEASIKEVDKWLQSDPGAFDWTYAYNYVKQIKGNRDYGADLLTRSICDPAARSLRWIRVWPGFIKAVSPTSTRWRCCAEEHRNALKFTGLFLVK
ncbi:nicotinamide N-methyltransferase-like isoform X4 [Engystomops pustulosus]|uniref:nicotinamide N-methyltransferase-like isoform X4 n=1 Tax=Engystomops pustulosus TaxID=76066 RepID=UPI003AFB42EC